MKRKTAIAKTGQPKPEPKRFEAFRDEYFGRVYVIETEKDSDGRRVFDCESEACEKAIADNLDTINELLATNAKLQQRLVHAIAQETARICNGVSAEAGK
jgi:hypothetical protein